MCVSEGGSRAGGEGLCGFTLAATKLRRSCPVSGVRERALTASAAQVAASEGWYKVAHDADMACAQGMGGDAVYGGPG